MQYNLGTRVIVGSIDAQIGVIANYGDDVWDYVCNTFNGAFTVKEAINAPCLEGLAERTRVEWVRIVLANVMVTNKQLYRIGKTYRWN